MATGTTDRVQPVRGSPLLALWRAAWSAQEVVSFLDKTDVACFTLARLKQQGEDTDQDQGQDQDEWYWPVAASSVLYHCAMIHGFWDVVAQRHHDTTGDWIYREAWNKCADAVRNVEDLVKHMHALGRSCPRAMLLARWYHTFARVILNNDALVEAVRVGNWEAVVFLHSLAPRYRYNVSRVAAVAAQVGHVDMVEWLLKHPLSLSIRNEVRDYDLHYTVHQRACDSSTTCVIWGFSSCASSVSGYLFSDFRRSLAGAAAAVGDLGVLEMLHDDAVFDPYNHIPSEPINAAVRHAQLEAAQWLHEHWSMALTEQTMAGSAASGDIPVVEWVFARTGEAYLGAGITAATERGHAHVVEWLLARISDTRSLVLSEKHVPELREAALESGDVGIVKQLEAVGVTIFNFDFESVEKAAAGGHCALVQWFLQDRTDARVIVGSDEDEQSLMEKAAESGNAELVRWLVETMAFWSPRAIVVAVHKGRLSVLQYLVLAARQDTSRTNLYTEICLRELKGGVHLEIVMWIVEHVPEVKSPVAKHSLHGIHILLCRLRDDRDPLWWKLVHSFVRCRPDQARAVNILPVLAVHGIDTVGLELLAQIDHPQLWTAETYSVMVERLHNPDMMKLFVRNAPQHVDSRVLQWAIKCGFDTLGAWIMEKLFEGNEVALCMVFGTAAKRGCLQMVETSYKLGLPVRGRKAKQMWHRASCSAVRYGHDQVLTWLLAHMPSSMRFRKKNTTLIDLALQTGQLHFIKLLTSAPHGLRGSVHGLAQALKYGHVETALFMCEVQPDITTSKHAQDLLGQIQRKRSRLQCILREYGDKKTDGVGEN